MGMLNFGVGIRIFVSSCAYAKFWSGDQNIRFKLINCFAICTVGKKNVFLILTDNNLF